MNFRVLETPEGARFLVRVTPRASRTAIVGVVGNGPQAALKIALQSPPVEGRANAALIRLLADLLRAPRSSIEIVGGNTGATRPLSCEGEVLKRLPV